MNETPAEPRKKKGSSKIEWTDDTDNAAAGCEEARLPDGSMSPECTHCYARLQSARLELMGMGLYNGVAVRNGGGEGNTARWTGVFRWDPELLKKRFREMKAGHKIFFGSMTDLWHPSHDPALLVALAVELRKLGERPAKRLPRAVITLTKHADRLLAWQREHFPEGLPAYHWPGVTAGVQAAAEHRVPTLIRVKAHGPKVVSVEPMLGPVLMDLPRCDVHGRNEIYVDPEIGEICNECALDGWSGELSVGHWLDPLNGGIGWVICGGESGQKARPMHPKWAKDLRDECVRRGVPFHFKQWGEWKPISEMTEEEMDAPYRSNRVAENGEDQANLDDSYGKTCTVPELVIRDNGEHRNLSDPLAFNSDAPGGNFMHAFRVGKARAGRLLDGREWNEYPETSGDQDAP